MCGSAGCDSIPAMLASVEVSSGWGLVAAIFVLGGLALLWLWSLFLVVTDSISAIVKVIWFILLTCLAPIAIPVYLVLRHFRHARQAG